MDGCEYVFVPDVFTLQSKGLTAAHAIVQVEEQFVPIKVIKPECDKVYLRKGTRLRVLEPFNDREGCGYVENIRLIEQAGEYQNQNSLLDINMTHLPRDQKEMLMKVLQEYSDVFSVSKMDIGCTKVVEHRIDTGSSPPIAIAPRRIPMALEEKVDKMISDLLENDIIKPSDSPWNAPIVVVAKKNGDIRMCVDYRKLNAVTKRPVYPIPATQQLLDCLNGARFFTTLDLSQGYHQIPMAEDDIPKTAFATRRGQFEYKRMPFGLSTAPATFQRLMHVVFKNENWEKCLIYLDDILIFGRSVEEHLERLKAVLQRIREAGLKLSPSKCSFLGTQVEYLGHIVSEKGIKTDPKKVDKVKNWPTPTTVQQLRSFPGFCGYYRRFIKDYSKLTEKLEALCQSTGVQCRKKNADIAQQWTLNHDEAFVLLKTALTTAPVLSYPTEKGRFLLDTDASHTGIGAVLSQIQDGTERVIAYASRRLTKAERRYCVTRKELLAVHCFVRHFKHYLFGRKFTVRTDHRALLWMLNWNKPNTSQYCLWKAELEMYDIEVVHRPGKHHLNADALSRLPNCHQCELKHEDPVTRRHVKILESTATMSSSIDGTQKSTELIMHMSTNCTSPEEWDFENDPELGTVVTLMRQGKIQEERMPDVVKASNGKTKELWRQRDRLRWRGSALYIIQEGKYKLVVPARVRRKLIKEIHSMIGHLGVFKTVSVIKVEYYWPCMEEDITRYIQGCIECQTTKGKGARITAPLQPSIVGEPFERIAIDISGPFRPCKNGNRYVLAIIDYFSKFPVLIPLQRIDAATVAQNVFHHWISVFGAPEIIHSDRGSNFESELFKEQCALFGIHKTRTSPYYPQSDGLVERLFRTIKPLISGTVQERKISWSEALPYVEMGLRCARQTSTGFSPFEIVYGKRMRLPIIWQYQGKQKELIKGRTHCQYVQDTTSVLEYVRKQVEQNFKKVIQRQSDYYNHNRRGKPLCIGDQALVKVEGHVPGSYPLIKYSGPYRVVKVKNDWIYELENIKNGNRIQRNFNQLKRFLPEAEKTRKMTRTSRETSISSQTNNIRTPLEQFYNEETQMESHDESQHISSNVPNHTVPDRRYPVRVRHHVNRYIPKL